MLAWLDVKLAVVVPLAVVTLHMRVEVSGHLVHLPDYFVIGIFDSDVTTPPGEPHGVSRRVLHPSGDSRLFDADDLVCGRIHRFGDISGLELAVGLKIVPPFVQCDLYTAIRRPMIASPRDVKFVS